MVVVLEYTFFNFVPTPTKFLRLKRFRKSYVNGPDVVLSNHTSYTASLLDVRCAVGMWSRSFFLQLLFPHASDKMADGCYKEFIIESINFIRNKDKKPTTESIFNYVKTKTGECDLDLLKSSLEALLDDKIIENRPRKNDRSGES